MPNCGCSKPCNCSVVSNGAPIIIESADQLTVTLLGAGREGWQDNIVQGSGRALDPYTVSWKDSLEYRPRAQEWRQSGSFPNGTDWTSEPTLYSTPTDNALFLWAATFPSDVNLKAPGILVGAYADVNTGGVAVPIEFSILFGFILTDPGPARIAHSVTSVSNPILACTGYINPARTVVDLTSSGLVAALIVRISSPNGLGAITAINQVRIWGVQV